MKLFEKILWTLAALWAVAALFPASFWFDAHDTRVDDLVEGDPLVLLNSGGPLRNFIGSYSVIIVDVQTRTIIGEDRSARFPYRVGTSRPDPLTIEWWAPGDPRMHRLAPGSYQMETCWTVHDAFWGLVPPKTTCSESNIFRVLPDELGRVSLRWPESVVDR